MEAGGALSTATSHVMITVSSYAPLFYRQAWMDGLTQCTRRRMNRWINTQQRMRNVQEQGDSDCKTIIIKPGRGGASSTSSPPFLLLHSGKTNGNQIEAKSLRWKKERLCRTTTWPLPVAILSVSTNVCLGIVNKGGLLGWGNLVDFLLGRIFIYFRQMSCHCC